MNGNSGQPLAASATTRDSVLPLCTMAQVSRTAKLTTMMMSHADQTPGPTSTGQPAAGGAESFAASASTSVLMMLARSENTADCRLGTAAASCTMNAARWA